MRLEKEKPVASVLCPGGQGDDRRQRQEDKSHSCLFLTLSSPGRVEALCPG